ncbi:MAG: BREX system P-loop protein BrxC [Synechococcaceae cyanobacterium SM2_3_2]|nr:BREX system P-loop protein BrxC [Synechococcaceae cyanobacterium SM2_3_2]
MKNREIYVKDPAQRELLNNGVAEVKDTGTVEELRTLRYELETFVCEGQYTTGLRRILDSYLHNLRNPGQPAVWVSGFYGSGKSHLVKMLRAFWVDYEFSDGATAQGLARLSQEVSDLLKELAIEGKRRGGLHAAAGTLGAGAGSSGRLALLSIVFKSIGLPAQYPLAKFVMWLRENDCLEPVKQFVEEAGKSWEKEINNLYVSPVISAALVNRFPNFQAQARDVGRLLKEQFPNVDDVSNDDMVRAMEQALAPDGNFPCTLIALDEVQQYIGDNSERTALIQEITETCINQFGSSLVFVATGQAAMSSTPQLQKLKDRFTVQVQLSDQDVDRVIREIILRKKPDCQSELQSVLDESSGEISRHLTGTGIETQSEDQNWLVPDYPLLPVRRRFWERALRVVDQPGTAAQLRNQLKLVHEATQATADADLGTVIGADFIFFKQQTELVQTGVLPREIHENIVKHRDGTPDGELKARLLGLAFLIGKLPREGSSDLGLRATADMMADLLVEDLRAGSADLRKRIPVLLQELVDDVILLQVGNEYRLQTRESSAWEADYKKFLAVLQNDPQRMADERVQLLKTECEQIQKKVRLVQGQSKESRSLMMHYSSDAPKSDQEKIPVWIRDGWTDREESFETDARTAGTNSEVVFMFIPRRHAENLQKYLASKRAAEQTLESKGIPATSEGKEARIAMETRKQDAEESLKSLLTDLFTQVRVLQGGGEEVRGLTAELMVKQAAEAALIRLFPSFDVADNVKWAQVIKQAQLGNQAALEVISYQGDPSLQPVCREVMKFIGSGKNGTEIRKNFRGSPFGWPQDAIDGSLWILLLNEHLKASQNGQVIPASELQRSKIGQTDFRVESVTVTTSQKLAIRKLCQEIGIPCGSGEEAAKVSLCLEKLKELAQNAGGDPPIPAPPDVSDLQSLISKIGNEQLVAVASQKEHLFGLAKTWRQTADRIVDRLPRWQSLQKLLKQSQDLPIFEEVATQVQAIQMGRLLLQDPDPVQPLCEQLTQELREALTQARDHYQQIYQDQMAELEGTESWLRLDPDQQDGIVRQKGLTQIPSIQVATETEVLRSVEGLSLQGWRNQTEALPQKFSQARFAAEKLLEPKVVQVRLPSGTLRSPEDAEVWLEQARQIILENLKQGSVIL